LQDEEFKCDGLIQLTWGNLKAAHNSACGMDIAAAFTHVNSENWGRFGNFAVFQKGAHLIWEQEYYSF
jgi:hypothetical protein